MLSMRTKADRTQRLAVMAMAATDFILMVSPPLRYPLMIFPVDGMVYEPAMDLLRRHREEEGGEDHEVEGGNAGKDAQVDESQADDAEHEIDPRNRRLRGFRVRPSGRHSVSLRQNIAEGF